MVFFYSQLYGKLNKMNRILTSNIYEDVPDNGIKHSFTWLHAKWKIVSNEWFQPFIQME